jgi:hypothetical protein
MKPVFLNTTTTSTQHHLYSPLLLNTCAHPESSYQHHHFYEHHHHFYSTPLEREGDALPCVRAATIPGIVACSPACARVLEPTRVHSGRRAPAGAAAGGCARVSLSLSPAWPPGCSVLGRLAGEFVDVRLLGGPPNSRVRC